MLSKDGSGPKFAQDSGLVLRNARRPAVLCAFSQTLFWSAPAHQYLITHVRQSNPDTFQTISPGLQVSAARCFAPVILVQARSSSKLQKCQKVKGSKVADLERLPRVPRGRPPCMPKMQYIKPAPVCSFDRAPPRTRRRAACG
jgi:hypothetical protein